MKKCVKIPLIVLGAIFGLFLVTFGIYFFNLDMKFMSYVVDPILQKHYDKMPRKTYL